VGFTSSSQTDVRDEQNLLHNAKTRSVSYGFVRCANTGVAIAEKSAPVTHTLYPVLRICTCDGSMKLRKIGAGIVSNPFRGLSKFAMRSFSYERLLRCGKETGPFL
jgi:hypothetical protein